MDYVLCNKEYLWKKDEATGSTRLGTILKDVKELLQKNSGFQVFCTGHSLGGALATLCGFYAAADDELVSLASSNPVVVYSFASPFCGNWKFRHAFAGLERLGRLQHLRVANGEDMVTLLPFFAPKATAFSPVLSAVKGAGNLYKHVGIRLQFRAKNIKGGDGMDEQAESLVIQHSLTYPKDQTSDEEYAKEVQDSLQAGKSLAKALYYLISKDFAKVQTFHR